MGRPIRKQVARSTGERTGDASQSRGMPKERKGIKVGQEHKGGARTKWSEHSGWLRARGGEKPSTQSDLDHDHDMD